MTHCNECDIVYDAKECPLCIANEDIERLVIQVQDLEAKVEDL